MATVTMAPRMPPPHSQSDENLSMLPDARPAILPPELSRTNAVSPQHPELSTEVAALSNKLIHAINHQTDLDDTLNDTRHQLEAAEERIRQLERADQEHKSSIENRILVEWADVEDDMLRLRMNLAEERKQRVQVENDKKAIEYELESLTTALFEEANQMVSAARKDGRQERDAVERRNEQLQIQLNDAELLLASHQEQLAELKQAMQEMSAQRNDLEIAASTSTAPPTPALDNQDQVGKLSDVLHLPPATPSGEDIPPAPPTHFSHLISPILRTDVPSYEDFHALLDISRRSGPSSRVTSGNYGGFSGLGLGNLGRSDQAQAAGRIASNGSTSSLSASNTHQSAPSTPNLPPSSNSSISSRDVPANGIPLKETHFYKRVLIEDIEPTLRLDTAPGLSWLARRGVVSSMCEGRLVVEPMPPMTKPYHHPCSLCGEQSRVEHRARKHRFRINESETAQRYPLCEYCLNRVRSTCDFLGFLRMVKDGYWRTDGPQAEAMAWEESVRLRERMFWSRIGGGVVPVLLRPKSESPRTSTDDPKPAQSFLGSQISLNGQGCKPEQPSPLNHEVGNEQLTPLIPDSKRAPPLMQVSEPEPPLHQEPIVVNSQYHFAEAYDASRVSGEPPSSLEQSSRAGPIEISQKKSSGPSTPRTATRNAASSCAENPGRTINSIAKRAAMFERTASDDAASSQLQASLQVSMKSRSPSRRIDASNSVPGAFDF